jgi:uncharacterized protein (DUF1778 family)
MAEPKKTKVRRKPKSALKEESIRIRVNVNQKKILSAAAARAGLGLSGWLLFLGLREAEVREK